MKKCRATIRLVLVLCILVPGIFGLVSCKTANSAEVSPQVPDPFANENGKRDLIVIISDLHLGADLQYAECNDNLEHVQRFLLEVQASPHVKELVIAGDLLDEWFVPALVDTYQGNDQADFMRRIAVANKGVIDALNAIIEEKNIVVTYVPGNHDLTVTEASVELIFPGINQARDPELGLGTYSPEGYPSIVVEHGHRYNFFCAPDPISNQDIAPGTISPPGYFFTRIAALHVMQGSPSEGEAIPKVTPPRSDDESQKSLYAYRKLWEWAIQYLAINNSHDEKIIVTNFDGFTDSYAINDLLPYQDKTTGLLDVNLFKGIQDSWDQRQAINRVAIPIPTIRAIASSASEAELGEQAKIQYFENPDSDVRIAVFGHTHVAKLESSLDHTGKKAIYANSGAWIDHNTISPTKREFVVIAPQGNKESSKTYVKLYSYDDETVIELAVDSLRL